MSIVTAERSDRGIALPAALMVMLLMAAITAGFTALVIMDTRVRAMDNTRTQAFYAVHAGLEKLTADLGDLFAANSAPTAAQINALTATPPAIGVAWQNPDGTNGYRINFDVNAAGNPDAAVMTVQQGPFQGLVGLATRYDISATGRLNLDRSEASLTRRLQTIAIPVFQFGIFSENDLSFFAGPDFNFGGRVHTNQHLFLAEGNDRTLTLVDRVTAVGHIIRTNLSNGWDTNLNYRGIVRAITAPAAFRPLERNEGSLEGTIGSDPNEPAWANLSQGTYNHNVMTGTTGARRLDLPITQFGATPVDLIKRPVVNEDVAAPNVLAERMFSLASLRILLSNTADRIDDLPTVTVGAQALGIAEPYPIANSRPHFAESAGPQQGGDDVDSQRYGSRTPAAQPLLGGFLKVEMCNRNLLGAGVTIPTAACWQDVTVQILSLGIAARQNPDGAGAPAGCPEPSPNAVIRLQRFRDRDAGCWNTQANVDRRDGKNFSPLTLYDPREALMRDVQPAALQFGGIMHYIEIDAGNLARWFRGQIPAGNCPVACTGQNALTANGYTVYFSDRRGNNDAAGNETGEFGFEDVVNANTNGIPNGGDPEVGEHFNLIPTLQTYGTTPVIPGAMTAPFCAAVGGGCANISRPWTSIDPANAIDATEEAAVARRNPAIFFRRALKLTNGATLVAVAPDLTGLTIVSENPVYVQGNWNANDTFAGAHVATAVMADSVTLLSSNWSDRNSVENGLNLGGRPALTTWYRMAVISGKGPSFPQPAGTARDFGTDGGAHNFLRYIENWGAGGGQTLNYRGSIASMFFSRQATGTYKCCTTVYSPPTRGYNFDADFLTPALLPPRTPMFRDVNITGFSQVIRPQ